MTALFSEEGASALGARFVTAQQFELKKYNKIKADPTTTSYQRGEAFGKAFGAITAYHIWESKYFKLRKMIEKQLIALNKLLSSSVYKFQCILYSESQITSCVLRVSFYVFVILSFDTNKYFHLHSNLFL